MIKDVKPIGYFYFNPQKPTENYVDLSGYCDDITVLNNPHKGWYIHFVDNGMHRSFYRDGIKKPDDIADIPGTKYLYLRLDWLDLEPEEGNFEFYKIDEIFDTYAPYGYKFIFRLCTYEASPHYEATPPWVFDYGAKRIKADRDLEPVYDDPIFLEHLEKFVAAFAERYDGHPLIESVDIGTIGTWGEGHTSFGSWTQYPATAYQKHVDMHVRYFTKTRLTMNYGLLVAFYGEVDAARDMARYSLEKGMGIRDDSLGVPYYIERYGYDTLITHDLFDMFYKSAPVDIEFGHYNQVGQPQYFKDGFPMLEGLKRSHATFAGFHGYVDKWLEDNPNFHNYIANRLGYWYFIDGYDFSQNSLKLWIRNGGFAPAYYGYTAKVVLVGKDASYTVFEGEAGNKAWQPDEQFVAEYTLDLSDLPKGEYDLYFGLFEGDTAIKLGLNQKLFDNGFYTLGTVEL